MQNNDINEEGLTDISQRISVRLTNGPREIEEAQRLRYRVFYEELAAAADREMAAARLDRDDFDKYTDHLIVTDDHRPEGDQIVGTYRLLRQEVAATSGGGQGGFPGCRYGRARRSPPGPPRSPVPGRYPPERWSGRGRGSWQSTR